MQNLLSTSKALVEQRFGQYLSDSKWPAELAALAKHSFLGGKGLRPALVFWAKNQIDGDQFRSEAAVDLACALEMVHCYSLIHDDLPAMDDDDFRRGRPTVHRLKDEAAAVLVGDAMLTAATHMIAASTALDDSQKLIALRGFGRSAGAAGLIAGQWRDMYEAAKDLDSLSEIHIRKTGELFSLAFEFAYLASRFAKTPQADTNLDCLRHIGLKLGCFFQLVDDLLDVKGSRASLGKTPGKDARQNKKTFADHLTDSESTKCLLDFKQTLLNDSLPFFKRDEFLQILDFIHHRIN